MTTILLIESNKLNLDLMVYLLNYHGYATLTAENGEDGIALAKQHHPALIITEINLPKMNGFEVAKVLKSDEELKKIPLLSVTAHAMLGDRNKVRQSGFDAYIPKPINPSHFIVQIEMLLPAALRSEKSEKIPIQLEPYQQVINTDKRGLAIVVNTYAGGRELIKCLLEAIGFDVIAVENGNEALTLSKTKFPDLILSDFNLPDLSGLDLLRAVRENPALKSTIFILTNVTYPGEESMKIMKSLKLNRFLLVPIESDIFLKIVSEICPVKQSVKPE